jgi:fibrillarin-like pre-rRNA processing protein
MKETAVPGVYSDRKKLFTINPPASKGIKIYNEKFTTINGVEYRSWNPYRSKLAAALQLGFTQLALTPSAHILYLGAATGTTVSHIADIAAHGIVYAVEHSPIAAKQLVTVCSHRSNIIPLLADANHPDIYYPYVSPVDVIYQDISQRNQADIFIKNITTYLKPKGQAIIMVKARSIDVALPPHQAFTRVADHLKQNGLTVQQHIPLEPYSKDHACLLITY